MGVRASSIIAGVCICMYASACNKTESIVSGTPPTAVLMSSSFEVGGTPSLSGWVVNSSDTTMVGFSTDIPAGGGHFSARMQNVWSIAGGVRAAFPAPSGVHRYRLSAWTKASSQGISSRGWMGVIVKTPDAMLNHKWLTFTDTIWTMRSLVDTVETGVSDSVIISLSGDSGQFSGGWTLFDLCVFERLD